MSKKAKALSAKSAEQCQSAKAPEQYKTLDMRIKEGLEALFASDWEIPDSAIEGKYARKIEAMESQIKSLTHRMLELQSKVEGKAPVEAGRVDAVAAVKKGKRK
ncbi:MAG TPA: hypothetical protein VFB72_18740 [Verrucomicrobiae bacterium]|nr:hypothetical protein [Verrucomicrobiae bacterium]